MKIATLRYRSFAHISLLLFIFCFCCLVSYSQNPGEWMWIHGSNFSNNAGNFGTQGVPAPTNEPPAIYEPCEFTDHNGNFWFYGGLDAQYSTGAHNDLWRFNTTTKEWTWMTGTHALGDAGNYGVMGVPSATNRPPSRSWAAQSWVDAAGNFWMIGGMSPGTTTDNALWKYDISTNQWTWMKGNQVTRWGIRGVPDTANNPQYSLEDAGAWTDNAGDLWLYSSNGALSKYNITTNTWTWMKGDTSFNSSTYLAKGVEDSINNPASSGTYCRWKDNSGRFWLYGAGYTNALWRFNPVTNNWAMMKGDTLSGYAHYGTKCVSAPDNVPSSRSEDRVAWTDGNGNLWMCGGGGVYNDLWMYSIANNEWTWVSGDNFINPPGNWGALNVSSPTNKPSGRMGTVSWSNGACLLYLYGGCDGGYQNFYNDLWVYNIDPACGGGGCLQTIPTANFIASDTIGCSESGMCINFSDQSTGNPTSWKWYFPGATPDSSSLQNPDSICYYNIGTYAVTLIVTNSGGTDTLTISPRVTLSNPPSPPSITVIGGDTLVSSYGYLYQWYLNGFPIGGATDSFYIAHQGGTYSVRITDNLGCGSISNGVLITAANQINGKGEPEVYPNPANKSFTIGNLPRGINSFISIYNVLGENMVDLQSEKHSEISIDVSNFAAGIYFLHITDKDPAGAGFIKKVVVAGDGLK